MVVAVPLPPHLTPTAGAIVVWLGRGRFEAIDRRFDGLEARLDGRFDGLEARLDRGIDSLPSSMDAMRSDLT